MSNDVRMEQGSLDVLRPKRATSASSKGDTVDHYKVIIDFDPAGRVRAMPDPLRVRSLDDVTWLGEMHGAPLPSDLTWRINFIGPSPLQGQRYTVFGAGAQSSRETVDAPPGDFKYAIEVLDSVGNRLASEDDPWLIVVP